MIQDDNYAKGQELSKDGIYQILAEEAWRDGELSGADSELLEGYRKYLRLANNRAMRILDVAEEKYRNQTIGRLRDFSPTHCYARALRYAYGDAVELSEKEAKYLDGLAAAVGLSDADRTAIRKSLEAKGWRPGPGTGKPEKILQADLAKMAEVGENLMETDRQPAVQAQDLVLDSVPPAPPPESDPSPAPEPEVEAKPTPQSPEPEAPAAAADVAPVEASDDGDPGDDGKSLRRRKKRSRLIEDEDGTLGYRAEAKPEPPRKKDDDEDEPRPRKRKKKRRRKPTPGPDATMSGRKRKKRRRKDSKSSLSKRQPEETTPPPTPLLERIPSTARIMLLVGCLTGGMLLVLPYLMPGSGPAIPTGDPPNAGISQRYQELEELHGKAAYKVKRLEVRGPDPPNGPALDLGEAWDLYAGRDGFLYGTSLYRIFRIDTRSGRAEWIAGSGVLGEPKDGEKAIEAAMDPADPRVDAAGTLYFRQGNTAVYRVERDGKLTRLLGSLESRQVWEDGTLAREARPGAIEQIALGAGGRLYFDEYSGETRGPEILGRIEPGDKLRAMFLFSMEAVNHPYGRLVKTFVGAGNGFENLVVGEDGAIYFAVGKRLYRWRPGQGPPTLLMPEAPLEFAVDRDGAVTAIRENRIERWYDLDKWTREERFVELIAGADDGIPTATEVLPLPGTAVAYHQPRSLTIDPDGMLFVLDGTVGGTGRARPRLDMIKRVDAPR